MDIEKSERSKLVDRFSEWFEFEQEVSVYSTHFNKKFRIDVLAKPKNEFSDLVLAFEVKNKTEWKMGNFGKACKQASDYVYCVVEEGKFIGKVINSAYIFLPEDGAQFREEEKEIILGIKHLAAKNRVGTLTTRREGKENWRATLRLFQELWYSDRGYSMHARGNLIGKRPIGGTDMYWEQIETAIKKNYRAT